MTTALAGSDALQTSAALAAALKTLPFDLVIAGNESTDGRTASVPAMLAERLDLPQVTFVRTLEVDGSTLRAERVVEGGYSELEATLPAVVSVTEKINEPRYPNFKGIMAAKSKPMTTLTARRPRHRRADDAGLANAWSHGARRDPAAAASRPARRSPTTATAAPRSPNSSPPPGSSERHDTSCPKFSSWSRSIRRRSPRTVTAELLALAARIGTPAAVVVGAPGTAAACATQLAALGRRDRLRRRIRRRHAST